MEKTLSRFIHPYHGINVFVEAFQTKHPVWFAAISLFVVNFLAYGVLAPWLGFYGDDWGYIWLLFKGPGLESFLGSSRVGFIPFYEFLAFILGPNPLAWFGYMLVVRIANSFAFWLILQKMWPQVRWGTLTAALLYAVYPGFFLNSAAVNISMFLILLTFFYLSIYLALLWISANRRRWVYLILALILSVASITLSEYFFFMELIRPIILFIFLAAGEKTWRKRLLNTLRHWLPFLAAFLATVIWRLMLQSKINAHYTMKLLEDFRADPFQTGIAQLTHMLSDLLQSGVFVWLKAIYPKQLLSLPNAPVIVFLGVLGLLLIVVLFYQFFITRRISNTPANARVGMLFIFLGFCWIMLGGWSIWLAKLVVTPVFSTTRFTMPFMPGAALLITGLMLLIPVPSYVRLVITSLLLAGSISTQLLVANFFRMDWVKQEAFYRQMTWRFPGLEKGTMVLISRNPLDNGEENSIASALNWIYSPGNLDGVDYYGYFNPEKFAWDLGSIEPGQQVTQPHLVGSFTADLGKSVAVVLDSRNCMRVLYPGLDEHNSRLNDFMRQYIPYTHPDTVLTAPDPITAVNLKQVFGSEPEHGWCWLYQQADLLSRNGEWDEITKLADGYLDPDEYRNDWQKLTIFIEAHIRAGEWGKAERLLNQIDDPLPGERAVFCRITKSWLDVLQLDPDFSMIVTDRRVKMDCAE